MMNFCIILIGHKLALILCFPFHLSFSLVIPPLSFLSLIAWLELRLSLPKRN